MDEQNITTTHAPTFITESGLIPRGGSSGCVSPNLIIEVRVS